MVDCTTCPDHVDVIAELKVLKVKVDANREISDVKFASNEKDKQFAKEDMERRLLDMNQFRTQLSNQANTFATRAELKTEAEKLDLKLAPLITNSSFRLGSTHWSNYILAALITAAIMLFVHFAFKV